MPKKSNITDEQIKDACAKADDVFFDLQNIAEEVRAARVDEITDIMERVRGLVNLSRVAADAAGALLYRKAMHDDRDQLRKELETRVAGGQA